MISHDDLPGLALYSQIVHFASIRIERFEIREEPGCGRFAHCHNDFRIDQFDLTLKERTQAMVSAFSGVAFSGGRHFSVLKIHKSFSRSSFAASRILSSNLPEGPTKGCPKRSSSAPGASPISISRQGG